MAEPLLACRGLKKSFGALSALSRVGLTLEAGEIHALIGPNGAGKTTLLSLLSGLLAADAGTILLEGRRIDRLTMPARARLGIARSFQASSVFEDFSVLENASLAAQAAAHGSARFWHMADRDAPTLAVARRALREVGLEGLEERPARRLAHGQKRQLELAMALATGPSLLLLDEPMAGLGPAERQAMASLIAGLKRRHAVLLVEHDMDTVFRLADRISVLVSGTILATGSPAAIRGDPKVQRAYLREED